MKNLTSKFLFLVVMAMNTVSANYIHENDLILSNTPTVNYEEFQKNIETLGAEVAAKTGWNIYLVLKKEIGEIEMIDYQKGLSVKLEKPFVLIAIADKEKKYGIYGSEGYRDEFDIDAIKHSFIEPILGSKVKGDPRAKYLAAMHNGYTEIAEQIAEKHKVTLENAIGNTNRNFISVLSLLIYGFLIIAAGIFVYKKYIVKGKK